MPSLQRRGVSKLLRVVKNEPHATEDDHESESHSPVQRKEELTLEDINADPQSSSDEDEELEAEGKSWNGMDAAEEASSSTSPSDPEKKRLRIRPKALVAVEASSSSLNSPEDLPFPPERKRKGGLMYGVANIHAKQPQPKKPKRIEKPSNGNEDRGFKIPQHAASSQSEREKPAFAIPKGLDKTNFGSSQTALSFGEEFGESINIDVDALDQHAEAPSSNEDELLSKQASQLERKLEKSQVTRKRNTRNHTSRTHTSRTHTSRTHHPPEDDKISQSEGLPKPTRSTTPKRQTRASKRHVQDAPAASQDIKKCSPLRSPSPWSSIRSSSPSHSEADMPEDSSHLPCPTCGAPVPSNDLELFIAKYPVMNVRFQQTFCKSHKRSEASTIWRERGYPEIIWEKLEYRMKRFNADISRLLEKPNISWFRKELNKRVIEGRTRNLLSHMQNEGFESISVGYYGTKGMNKMTDFITRNFSSRIRSLAASDTLISSRGPSAYIQVVLVPELATLLIKQDMQVSVEGARKIMAQSTLLGDLLNGPENDSQHQ